MSASEHESATSELAAPEADATSATAAPGSALDADAVSDQAESTPEERAFYDASRDSHLTPEVPPARRWSDVVHMPPLALVAVVAAVVELTLDRVVAPMLVDRAPQESLLRVMVAGDFALNTTAVATIVALGSSLVAFLRRADFARIVPRLGLAALAGVFLPTVVLATVLPRERTTLPVVVFAAAAAHVLSMVTATLAMRRKAPAALDVALGVVAFCVGCAMVALLCEWSPALSRHAWAPGVGIVARQLGEGAYLLVAPLVGLGALPRTGTRHAWLARGAGLLVFLTLLILLGWARLRLGHDFAIALYFAQRLGWLLEHTPGAYIPAVALAFSVGLTLLWGPDAIRRQAGAALLSFLAAGFAARTPAHLGVLVLSVMLLSRVAVAWNEEA